MLNRKKFDTLKDAFNFSFCPKTLALIENWYELFINYNSHTNLMSKGDVDKIFEKHIFDSLAILKWQGFDPKKELKILDVGTGGGFPSVILAICFPNLEIVANDSRVKKINFIMDAKDKLNLKNLKFSLARVEDLEPLNCDIVTSRAVGKIKDVWKISKKHLKEGGNFVIYKAKTAQEEILEFKNSNKNFSGEIQVIPYDLPLEEDFTRNLVVIST